MSHEDLIAGKLAEELNELRSGLSTLGEHLKAALASIPGVPHEGELARRIGAAIPAPEPAAPPAAPAPAPAALNNQLLYRMAALEYAKSQSEILEVLLQGLQDFAQRAALLVLRDDTLQGWSGFGFDSNVKAWKGTLGDDPILRTVAGSRTRMLLDGAVPSFIPPGETVRRSMIAPLLLKGKASALVYADSGEGGKLDHYSVDVLVRTASLVIDIFPLRAKREPLPPALENQGIISPTAAAAEAAEDSVLFEDTGSLADAQDAEEAPANQTVVADIPEEVSSYVAPPAETYEVAEVVEEVPVAPEPEPEPEPVIESTAPSKPKEEPVPPGEEKLHEDAQRFARLLVQEIALYHPREVEQGKRNKNLYSLLREDIDRSREAYEHRYQKPSVQGRQYFEKALAKYLADGDPSLLGM
jgi:hypothetical protein